MEDKKLAGGKIAYYWELPKRYKLQKCPLESKPLGSDYAEAKREADALNQALDEWRRPGAEDQLTLPGSFSSVDWLIKTYLASDPFKEKVSARARPDYERTLLMMADLPTKDGRRVGQLTVRSITGAAVDKIYDSIIKGGRGNRFRTANLCADIAKRAWKVVFRLHPDQFNSKNVNPWEGLTRKGTTKAKPAVDRETCYAGAQALLKAGYPELAAAAVICFEWLQRPENVLGGYISWTDYHRDAIRIAHHKTGEMVWHPLEATMDGHVVRTYSEAEAILQHLPKRGTAMILRQLKDGTCKPWDQSDAGKVVRKVREAAGLPDIFTLDACRHGGMTELEEAELTEGQGMALSGHKTPQAYRGYAKKTLTRTMGATMKRLAWRQNQNQFRNEPSEEFRNARHEKTTSA
jgi:hypothetical protein